MKRIFCVLFLIAALGCLTPLFAGVCPPAGAAADCNLLITFSPTGSISLTYPDPNPYDGSDDILIGVVNNTPTTINSLIFMGSGNGGGAFMFDGDGACLYGPTCSHPPLGTYVSIYGDNGYYDQGSGVWFTNVNAAEDTGTVHFYGGIAPGGTAWWSLESAAGTGPIQINGPEPATMTLLGGSMLVLFRRFRNRK